MGGWLEKAGEMFPERVAALERVDSPCDMWVELWLVLFVRGRALRRAA